MTANASEDDRIACEDTRVTRVLLDRFGIQNRPYAYHEHNADEAGPRLIAALEAGKVHVAFPVPIARPIVYPMVIVAGSHDKEAAAAFLRYVQSPDGQAVFARLFVPCFDEPRFKTPWQLSVVVPKSDVALSNAPASRLS